MDLEPDFEVFIYYVEEPESSDSNEKTTCDNIVESSTWIPLEVTPIFQSLLMSFLKIVLWFLSKSPQWFHNLP